MFDGDNEESIHDRIERQGLVILTGNDLLLEEDSDNNNVIQNAVAPALAKTTCSLHTLATKDLGDCFRERDAVLALADALRTNQSLRHLIIKDDEIVMLDVLLNAIRSRDRDAPLHTLALMAIVSDDFDAAMLSVARMLQQDESKNCTCLQTLKIVDCPLTLHGIQILSQALSVNTTLEELDLGFSHNNASSFLDLLHHDDSSSMGWVPVLFHALKNNTTLHTLRLHGVLLCRNEDVTAVADTLCCNQTIQRLTVWHDGRVDLSAIMHAIESYNATIQEIHLSRGRHVINVWEQVLQARHVQERLEYLMRRNQLLRQAQEFFLGACSLSSGRDTAEDLPLLLVLDKIAEFSHDDDNEHSNNTNSNSSIRNMDHGHVISFTAIYWTVRTVLVSYISAFPSNTASI